MSLGGHHDAVHASGTVGHMSALFKTTFHTFAHSDTPTRVVRAVGPLSLPARIRAIVSVVDGLASLPSVTSRYLHAVRDDGAAATCMSTDCKSAACCNRVTPGVLKARYEVPDAVGGAGNKTSMAVAEFQGQKHDEKDLGLFLTNCNQPNTTVAHQIGNNADNGMCVLSFWRFSLVQCRLVSCAHLHAVVNHLFTAAPFPSSAKGLAKKACWTLSSSCVAALAAAAAVPAAHSHHPSRSCLRLVTFYQIGMANGIPLTDVYVSTYSLLDWASTVGNLSDATIPHVHSISYGNDERQQTSKEYMLKVSGEFAKLAARGITIFVASGDQGPCGRSGCGDVYNPDFPASSPYVTAVGGTNFATRNVIGEETVWDSSGCVSVRFLRARCPCRRKGEGLSSPAHHLCPHSPQGFSDVFAQPSWQKTVVSKYLGTASGLPPKAKFNASGRAYPDLSALGGGTNPYCTAVGSLMGAAVYGTSAATPVAAAVFARINAERLAVGKTPMGWLNPFIYANPSAFNDVTTGVSNGGGRDGFPASAGWDVASGSGTPKYADLLAAALKA